MTWVHDPLFLRRCAQVADALIACLDFPLVLQRAADSPLHPSAGPASCELVLELGGDPATTSLAQLFSLGHNLPRASAATCGYFPAGRDSLLLKLAHQEVLTAAGTQVWIGHTF